MGQVQLLESSSLESDELLLPLPMRVYIQLISFFQVCMSSASKQACHHAQKLYTQI